jgi:hypothetical protein
MTVELSATQIAGGDHARSNVGAGPIPGNSVG